MRRENTTGRPAAAGKNRTKGRNQNRKEERGRTENYKLTANTELLQCICKSHYNAKKITPIFAKIKMIIKKKVKEKRKRKAWLAWSGIVIMKVKFKNWANKSWAPVMSLMTGIGANRTHPLSHSHVDHIAHGKSKKQQEQKNTYQLAPEMNRFNAPRPPLRSPRIQSQAYSSAQRENIGGKPHYISQKSRVASHKLP
jgi:hypothetical protein